MNVSERINIGQPMRILKERRESHGWAGPTFSVTGREGREKSIQREIQQRISMGSNVEAGEGGVLRVDKYGEGF